MEVNFEVIEGPLDTKPEIIRLDYDLHNLVIHIEPAYSADPIVVTFDSSVGFRVLDEGNLLEYWDHLNLNDGWLFQISSGGWYDLESTRSGFVSQNHSDVREYLIVGLNECISVLSMEPPKVVVPGPNKQRQSET
ncbi:hypothetical protein QP938_09890 [Porticoccaceae bacterium LTM1]|nr:hypothetical protein QP938_09890 [Porticoccaceae bacterium LTM1]